jgi:hypothetical protein
MSCASRRSASREIDPESNENWPSPTLTVLVVEEDNIAAQVASLRKVLRSDVIVTIPGRGMDDGELERLLQSGEAAI